MFYKEGVFLFWGPSKSLQNSKWLFYSWFDLQKTNLFGLWLFCIRHRRGQSLQSRKGPTQNLTKPSKRRAEKDKTREVVFGLVCSFFLFFFFNFCFYYVLGDRGSKLDQGSGFFGFGFFFFPLFNVFPSLSLKAWPCSLSFEFL